MSTDPATTDPVAGAGAATDHPVADPAPDASPTGPGGGADAPLGFPERMLRLAEAPGMPDLYGRPVRVWDRWQLHPGAPMHDVGALLVWAAQMTGPVTARAARAADPSTTELRVRGVLAGQDVELVGLTRRRVARDDAGRVELAVLRQLADAECWVPADRPPPLTALSDAETADPLGTARGVW